MKKNKKIEKLEWVDVEEDIAFLLTKNTDEELAYVESFSPAFVIRQLAQKLDEVIDRLNEMEEKK